MVWEKIKEQQSNEETVIQKDEEKKMEKMNTDELFLLFTFPYEQFLKGRSVISSVPN